MLVEAGVVGREVEIAVLGGRTARARPGLRRRRDRRDRPGVLRLRGEVPRRARRRARLPGRPARGRSSPRCSAIAIAAFEAIGGAGLARVDFFLTDDGFVVNEINTMPGFTPISMFPTCWLDSGLSYPELIDELIRVAVARGVRVG